MIRVATLDDVPGIQVCASEAYGKYVERIGKKPAPMIADFDTQVRRGIVYVSVDGNGDLEGFIVFYPRKDHIHLENVAVASSHQGKGIGKKLIKYCENAAIEIGVERIELYTHEKMTENLNLYTHLGYEEVGRWPEDGFNRVFYQKRIQKIC